MVCCRNAFVNTSDECRPLHVTFSNYYKSPKYLTNGRPCIEGFCENEVCIQRVKDYVSRFWKVIQTVTVSGFVEFMKRNIVGSIITVSLAFWVPISCCIHFCIDKRNIAYQKQKIRSNENYNVNLFYYFNVVLGFLNKNCTRASISICLFKLICKYNFKMLIQKSMFLTNRIFTRIYFISANF